MRTTLLIILGLILTAAAAMAQSERKLVRSGNGEYGDGNFSEAEVQYRKALDKNPNYFNGKFNLGDAMYQQENYEESARMFNDLAEANITDEEKASVYYNLGNNFMKGQKWGEAVESFKRSLRLKPDDYDAKYNLEYARKKMKDQQQQQQNQDQNQDQDKDQDKQDQENKDQNQDQQDKDDQQDQQDKQDQQQDQQDQKDQQQDKQQQQQQQQQISREDAQRMLDALKNDEKSTLQKLQKEKARAVKAKKSEIDW
jgi:tetratricopeptide (TPR) repeat protein